MSESRPSSRRPGAMFSGALQAIGAKAGVLPAWGALALLAGCSAAPVPPTLWLRLGSELPPAAVGAPAPSAAAQSVSAGAAPALPAPPAAREVWQLMLPVPLPAHLDRDGLYLPQGAGGALVRPLAGARWVEPLRDAVPRVLREDLARRMGGQVLWAAPLPPGLVPTRQLRVEIPTFEINSDGATLATQARWSIADARGTRPPVVHEVRFATPAADPASAGSWALAHRQAIATLAERIAATLPSP